MSTHNLFLSRNKKNNVYPYKPQFYYKKVGFKGVKIILECFRGLVGHSISYKIVTAPSEDSGSCVDYSESSLSI